MPQGLYLKGAIQNSGVTRGNNGDVRIYGNGGVQIYPRELPYQQTQNDCGGMWLGTISQRYKRPNPYYPNPVAQQGYYNGPDGDGGKRAGHMFWYDGKPTPPRNFGKSE